MGGKKNKNLKCLETDVGQWGTSKGNILLCRKFETVETGLENKFT